MLLNHFWNRFPNRGNGVVSPFAAVNMPYIVSTDMKTHMGAATKMLSKLLIETPSRINVIVNPNPCLMWKEANGFLFSEFIDSAIKTPTNKI